MANVTNSGFWQSFTSNDDLKDLDRAELPHLVRHVRSMIEARRWTDEGATTGATEAGNARLVELSVALHRSFDATVDRVTWDLPELESADPAKAQRRFRFDGKHEAGSPRVRAESDLSRLSAALGRAYACAKLGLPHWVVGVVSASAAYPQSIVDRLQSLNEQHAALLLVVCDFEEHGDEVASVSSAIPPHWRRLAIATGLDEIGPLPGGDVARLIDTLERIKLSGSATILHLTIPAARSTSAQLLMPSALTTDAPLTSRSYFESAAEHLAACAARDPRIMAVSLGCGRQWLSSWPAELAAQWIDIHYAARHALAWCAGTAEEGCRPFVFLSRPAFHRHFGALREEICLKNAPVTLLLDGANSPDGASAADLAALQLMPNLPVLSPKDRRELSAMLDWSLGQQRPAAILLPSMSEPEDLWEANLPVIGGRAELVMPGEDVVILAFGGMVGPATSAAKRLAAENISAAVINARFVAPLDRQRMVQWIRQSMSVLIVEEHSQGCGFSGRVLELLAETGAAQIISVIAPLASQRPLNPEHRYERTTRAILERCRWLCEPIDPLLTADRVNGSVDASDGERNPWLELVIPELARSYALHDQVLAQQPSSSIRTWMDTYLKVGRRKLYFWQWCVLGAELTTMPCVSPPLRAEVCETKVLSIMLCVLLDDVADLHGKRQLLEALLAIIGGSTTPSLAGLSAEDREYAEVTQQLSDIYQARICRYPRYAEFADLLDYDLMQYFNTMRYSHLLNHQLPLLNVTEHDLYMPHAMHMMSFATLDLMCAPGFDQAELGTMREVIWHAACMGRIGNLLGTWRREISEHDFNSGVFARAVTAGDLTMADLAAADQRQIENAVVDGRHEDHFLARWHFHRQRCLEKVARIHSVNLDGFVAGQEQFFHMHLDCRGRI